jgi:hypothetical protein
MYYEVALGNCAAHWPSKAQCYCVYSLLSHSETSFSLHDVLWVSYGSKNKLVIISLNHVVCVMEILCIFGEVGILCLNSIYLNLRLQIFSALKFNQCYAQYFKENSEHRPHVVFMFFIWFSNIGYFPKQISWVGICTGDAVFFFCEVETEF